MNNTSESNRPQTVREISQTFNVSASAVYRKARTGHLPVLRFGKKILILPQDFMRLLRAANGE